MFIIAITLTFLLPNAAYIVFCPDAHDIGSAGRTIKGQPQGHQRSSDVGRKLLVREREGGIPTAYAKRPIPEYSVQPSGDPLSGCLGSYQ